MNNTSNDTLVAQRVEVVIDRYPQNRKWRAWECINNQDRPLTGAELAQMLHYMWERKITEATRSRIRSYINGMRYETDVWGMPPYTAL